MPKPMDEDRLRRKQALEEKRAARRAKKEQEERLKVAAQQNGSHMDTANQDNGTTTKQQQQQQQQPVKPCYIWTIPEESVHLIFSFLCAADLGRLLLTCNKTLGKFLPTAVAPYLFSRLHTTTRTSKVNLCDNETTAQGLLEAARHAGGDTGRLVVKQVHKTLFDVTSYARFLEQVVTGYCELSVKQEEAIRLPVCCQGRFASASPEHSLCRVGGSAGVASWGVGKRGQLGHGKRADQREPRRLMQGIGYLPHLQIVQVSAGGGLVRVAHSLLLTNTGRVLSFGTGQYGALGHGYSAAKQLPDVLRPQYIEALSHVTCVCVAAGELHSAVVTSDGDLYTWGDGFCGQLGHGDKRPQLLPKQVTQGGLDDECVASITCGSRHTVAVTEEGEVFSWGLGHFGVLGRSFTPFDYDADAAVVAFTGGGDEMMMEQHPAPGAIVPPVHMPPPPQAVNEQAPPGEVRDMAQELRDHLDLIANLSLDDSSDQCFPKQIESLEGIKIVGASAGHRHTLLLDDHGRLYSCGAGTSGCLGHGDILSQMHPVCITSLVDDNVCIRQMSAGVDMSMAVSTDGKVYAWGRTDGGRIGLGLGRGEISSPRLVSLTSEKNEPIKAVDVECGYVHSLIVALDGTLHLCGGVGVEGEADGQRENEEEPNCTGGPRLVRDFNIWHRLPEPKAEEVKKERWKKYGKYEVRGRSKMLND